MTFGEYYKKGDFFPYGEESFLDLCQANRYYREPFQYFYRKDKLLQEKMFKIDSSPIFPNYPILKSNVDIKDDQTWENRENRTLPNNESFFNFRTLRTLFSYTNVYVRKKNKYT